MQVKLKPLNIINNRFGYLTVIKESEPILKDGWRTRTVLVKCDCGNLKVVRVCSIKSGLTKSCGCLSSELKSKRMWKHGEVNTRIYKCWIDMRRRSKMRDNCYVDNEWNDFLNFKNWSLKNGYSSDLILCRKGDTGNYSPNNVRWGTAQSNVEESLAKRYLVTKPSGDQEVVYNMNKFCRENNLDPCHMSKVSNGKAKKHKQYKSEILKCE